MDPQYLLVSPDDFWRLHEDVKQIYAAQAEVHERLLQVERRQDEDNRLKSLWNTSSSSFPNLMAGVPQQGALHPPPGLELPVVHDGHSFNMLGGLQLEQHEEEPRRGASRANSVRFDESARQSHWPPTSRFSGDQVPARTSGGLGGQALMERSSSHKSDGRQSSMGQSIHSIHSTAPVKPSSLGLDTSFLLGHAAEPAVANSMPSIIRCWLDRNFSNETLIYAAVCTGSYESYLDMRLVLHLKLDQQVQHQAEGRSRIKLAVYLPEAVVSQPSSRSSSPTPQLPSITVEFTVLPLPLPLPATATPRPNRIEVFLGWDALTAHHADILLSTNRITLHGDNQDKLSVPLVQPEDAALFQSLFTASAVEDGGDRRLAAGGPPEPPPVTEGHRDPSADVVPGVTDDKAKDDTEVSMEAAARSNLRAAAPSPQSTAPSLDDDRGLARRRSSNLKESVEYSATSADEAAEKSSSGGGRAEEATVSSPAAAKEPGTARHFTPARDEHGYGHGYSHGYTHAHDRRAKDNASPRDSPGGGAGVWGPWRREGGARADANDSPGAGKGNGYQRAGRPRGTKVLRPSRSSISSIMSPRSYSTSSAGPAAAAAADGPAAPDVATGEPKSGGNKELLRSALHPSPSSNNSNPVGVGSAFGWLSGGPATTKRPAGAPPAKEG
ncbi:MAG: CSN-associated deubiquitinating enzyme Ubp12 [Phylliscum demangeonii]|nr:MAG: CSN-associated deubiquitinating enzyme Ubp12 [Phylliscum demangeonii]